MNGKLMSKLIPRVDELPLEARPFLVQRRSSKVVHWLAGAILLATLLDTMPISNIPTLRTVSGAFGIPLAILWAYSRGRTLKLPRGAFAWLSALIVAIVYMDVSRFIATGNLAIGNTMQWFQALIFGLILMDIARDYRAIPILMGSAFLAIFIVAVLGLFGTEVAQGRQGAEIFNLNNQAYYLGLLVIGLLVYILARWPRLDRMGLSAWAVLSFVFMMMVQTGSRGGLAATVAGVVVVLGLMVRRRNLSAYLTLLPLAAASAIFLFASSEAALRWERTLEGEDYGTRDVIWPAALAMFYDAPLLGNGPGFILELGKMTRGIPTSTHNQYLMLLVAYGIMGLILWLGIVITCLTRCWRYRRHPAAVALLGMLICSLVFCLAGDLTFKRYFWVLIAIAANIETVVLAYPYVVRSRGRCMEKSYSSI